MQKILFVTYGGGHVNMVVPIVKELKKRGDWDVTVLGLTTAKKILEKNGIPALGFLDLVTDKDRAAIKLGEKLAREYHNPKSGIAYDEAVAYLGLSYYDLVERLGEETAKKEFELKGRRAFLPFGPITRLIDKISPNVIAATNSPRAETAVLLLAGKMKIPSICVVDLLGTDWEDSYITNPGYGSVVTVFSEYAKEHLISKGRNAEEIIITGNPACDKYENNADRKKVREYLKSSWKNKKIILWASQEIPEREITEAIFKELIRLSEKHSEWQFIYRAHPSETPFCIPSGCNIEFCPKEVEIEVVLAVIDIVLLISSTVGLEAALLGKNVIQIMTSSSSQLAPYNRMGISHPVNQISEIEEAIIKMTFNSHEAKILKNNRKKLPKAGKATMKICDIIDNL